MFNWVICDRHGSALRSGSEKTESLAKDEAYESATTSFKGAVINLVLNVFDGEVARHVRSIDIDFYANKVEMGEWKINN